MSRGTFRRMWRRAQRWNLHGLNTFVIWSSNESVASGVTLRIGSLADTPTAQPAMDTEDGRSGFFQARARSIEGDVSQETVAPQPALQCNGVQQQLIKPCPGSPLSAVNSCVSSAYWWYSMPKLSIRQPMRDVCSEKHQTQYWALGILAMIE